MTTFILTARSTSAPAVVASFLVGVLATGCASSGSLGEDHVDTMSRPSRAGLNSRGGPLFQWEIRAAYASSAYDAVRKLRPLFFASRSMGMGQARVNPSVVIDGGIPEPLDALRMLQVDGVTEIRFLEPFEAAMQYGSAFTAGIILVIRAPSR
jgi:hypothetical protein